MSTPPAPGKAPPMVSDLAFVDDTSLVGPGHTELTRMTDVGTEFFGMHGIEINGKKTELLAINPTQKGLIGYFTHCRLQDVQRAARLWESPLSNPAIASMYTQHNLIARVYQLKVERDVNLCDVSIEVSRVKEREEENQGHADEKQEVSEEEEVVLWELGSEDEEEPPEVRDKLRQQAAKEAAEEGKGRKKTEKQAERSRRRQELERALPPKRRLMGAVKAQLKKLEAEAYPPLPANTERIQHQASSNTPKHSYSHIIMEEATQSAM
ncbi:hypothetical protein K457DRAFT_22273 [Linnemannia elongata AG-77]|uniref:Uncharacterized protein n=1 Tax=Linnemannia elongata AG-77 TaxID=1314771 RepID=A0A197JM54_9FUNG|nr:hypothetical protein K457DRAFT_22273 [Linnemannia elongata AG-77]